MRRRSAWALVALLGCGPTAPAGGTADDETSTGGGESGSSTAPSTSSTSSTSGTSSSSTSSGTSSTSSTTDKFDIGGVTGGGGWGCAEEACPDPRLGWAKGSASTPVGDFLPVFAFFGIYIGCGGCGDGVLDQVILVEDPEQPIQPGGLTDGLIVRLPGGFAGPIDTPLPAEVWAYRDGSYDWVGGAELSLGLVPPGSTFEEPFDPTNTVVVPGWVALEAADWSVHVDFAAAWCPGWTSGAVCE